MRILGDERRRIRRDQVFVKTASTDRYYKVYGKYGVRRREPRGGDNILQEMRTLRELDRLRPENFCYVCMHATLFPFFFEGTKKKGVQRVRGAGARLYGTVLHTRTHQLKNEQRMHDTVMIGIARTMFIYRQSFVKEVIYWSLVLSN